jgi:hypothetical protein
MTWAAPRNDRKYFCGASLLTMTLKRFMAHVQFWPEAGRSQRQSQRFPK